MRAIFALASIFLASTAAIAADLAPQSIEPVSPAVTPPVFNWTGFYAGIHGGGLFAQAKGADRASGSDLKFKGSGFLGGVHAGYNAQFGRIVVGIENDIDYSSLSKSDASAGLTAKFQTDWQGSGRVRLGYAIDNFLPYLTAGAAVGNEKVSIATSGATGSLNKLAMGWTAGGGLEYAVDENWLLRGEVRYTDLSDKELNIAGDKIKLRFNQTSATLGVGYKF
ncbi:outer membrane protein [Labrys okinawensis]|uniref:outer membrane protein n=1 Tax=Labrys okinawensis TaxID=346911 RepID=UPI0039BC7C11